MFRSKHPRFEVTIAQAALNSIFDECDEFEVDETGGRIIGTYTKKGNAYDIRVLGVLGPGPHAKRSPTSFFQDGEYQERIFRMIEERHRNIEHLGNWHTHHVNGLQTLSSGDKTTYRATVNHRNHNTDFFYALLVTRKTSHPERRYDVKHYFFRRDDDEIYEIPDRQVRVVDLPAVWTRDSERPPHAAQDVGPAEHDENVNPERAKDAELFSAFYPELKSLFSQKMGSLYWKGPLNLVDGSSVDVVALEISNDGKTRYSVTASSENSAVLGVVERYRQRTFNSARHAVLTLERDTNRALYRAALRSS